MLCSTLHYSTSPCICPYEWNVFNIRLPENFRCFCTCNPVRPVLFFPSPLFSSLLLSSSLFSSMLECKYASVWSCSVTQCHLIYIAIDLMVLHMERLMELFLGSGIGGCLCLKVIPSTSAYAPSADQWQYR